MKHKVSLVLGMAGAIIALLLIVQSVLQDGDSKLYLIMGFLLLIAAAYLIFIAARNIKLQAKGQKR